jgi:hypothetical protein
MSVEGIRVYRSVAVELMDNYLHSELWLRFEFLRR